jgi:hypothetical protein
MSTARSPCIGMSNWHGLAVETKPRPTACRMVNLVGNLPAMGPNRRAQERERAAARAAAKAKRAEADRKAIVDAQKVVAVWNAHQAGGRALWFYPTIGAAIAAGLPWLSFSCPACGQFGSVDLRMLDRHPGGAISGLIPSVSCLRCSLNAPFARLEMLSAERP